MFEWKSLLVPLWALALSGCVVAPYPYARPVAYYPAYTAQPVVAPAMEPIAVVDVAPPAPYVEVVPAVPFVGALWIGGYWGWNGGRHQWVPGRYEHPRAGYAWQPHAWVQQGGHWQLHSGGWVRH
jgi:hypothetical protein